MTKPEILVKRKMKINQKQFIYLLLPLLFQNSILIGTTKRNKQIVYDLYPLLIKQFFSVLSLTHHYG